MQNNCIFEKFQPAYNDNDIDIFRHHNGHTNIKSNL